MYNFVHATVIGIFYTKFVYCHIVAEFRQYLQYTTSIKHRKRNAWKNSTVNY
jgi:hypothetical protein